MHWGLHPTANVCPWEQLVTRAAFRWRLTFCRLSVVFKNMSGRPAGWLHLRGKGMQRGTGMGKERAMDMHRRTTDGYADTYTKSATTRTAVETMVAHVMDRRFCGRNTTPGVSNGWP